MTSRTAASCEEPAASSEKGLPPLGTPASATGPKSPRAVTVVICGPSGSGKSSIISHLLQRNPNVFKVCLSHYIFVEKKDFEAAIRRNEFIEYAIFSGNYYGTSKVEMKKVLQEGKICIFELDAQGVEQIRKTDIQPVCIFIRPRNYATLEQRLWKYSVESEEHILQRLAVAHQEMQYALEDEIFDKIVVNENLESAVREIEFFLQEDQGLNHLFEGPWKRIH